MATRTPWQRHAVTPRQRYAIQMIRTYMGVPFDGRTKGEAVAYISKYYDTAKEMKRLGIRRLTNRALAKRLLEKEEKE